MNQANQSKANESLNHWINCRWSMLHCVALLAVPTLWPTPCPYATTRPPQATTPPLYSLFKRNFCINY